MSVKQEELVASKVKEPAYSINPQTKCPKGGRHIGLILEKCTRCRAFLTPADFVRAGQQPSVKNGKLHIIKCCECGASREVKPQDLFQVKRCKPCQAKRSGRTFKKFLSKVKRKRGGAA